MTKVRYYHFEDNRRIEETIKSVENRTKMKLWRIEIAVTSRCSLACDYCRVAKVPDKLTSDIIDRIFGEARELGVQHSHIIGGEPTIRDDLPEIIEKAIQRCISTSLITNGASRNTVLRDYARRMVENGLSSVTVSLDTPNAERNDKAVGVSGAWQTTVNFLAYMNDAKQLLQRNVPIYINSVADKNTIFELPERIHFYGSLGCIDDVKLLLIKGDKTRFIDKEAHRRFRDEKLERVIELSKRFGFNMLVDDITSFLGTDNLQMQERIFNGKYYLPSNSPCYITLSELFIASNGDVYNCRYHFWHSSQDVRGNVTRQNLAEIWNGYNPLEHNVFKICEGLCTRKVVEFNNQVNVRLGL